MVSRSRLRDRRGLAQTGASLVAWAGSFLMPSGYQAHLKAAVANSAAPYGYTLTVWTSGAVATHANGLPTTVEALLFLAGAVVGFAAVGAVAHGGPASLLHVTDAPRVRLWGSFHLPSVGLAIGVSALVAHFVGGAAVWPLVGSLATVVYLVGVAGQYTLAETRRGE